MFKSLLVPIAALASTPAPFDISEVLQTGVTTVQGNVMTALGIVVPAIIVVVGAVVSVKFGIKWLKSLKG